MKDINEYTITKSTVECYKIRHPSGMYWADITIDTVPGSRQGRIQIASDYGSYQCFWGACGPTFKDFLAHINIDYAASNFGATGWFDLNETIKGIRHLALEQKAFIEKDEYKLIQSEIKDLSDYVHEHEFINEYWNKKNLIKLYDGSYPDIVKGITPQFKKFWDTCWKVLLNEFEKEKVLETINP
jgi:hypothetical protein